MQVEYFNLTHDFWIARWLKKPSTKKIIEGKNIIDSKNVEIIIGVDIKLVNKIIEKFKKLKLNGKYIDLTRISTTLSLPLPLIRVILIQKKVIRKGEY